jgi:hypothetical protein
MAQRQSGGRTSPDRQRHLLTVRSGGRVLPAPNRRALKTRKETTSGIWHWREPRPSAATPSGLRTTTNTPNIISDRCLWTRKRHRSLGPPPLKGRAPAQLMCGIRRPIYPTGAQSPPYQRRSLRRSLTGVLRIRAAVAGAICLDQRGTIPPCGEPSC